MTVLKRDPQNCTLATKNMREGRALLNNIIGLSNVQQKTKEYVEKIEHVSPKAVKATEDTASAVADAQ